MKVFLSRCVPDLFRLIPRSTAFLPNLSLISRTVLSTAFSLSTFSQSVNRSYPSHPSSLVSQNEIARFRIGTPQETISRNFCFTAGSMIEARCVGQFSFIVPCAGGHCSYQYALITPSGRCSLTKLLLRAISRASARVPGSLENFFSSSSGAVNRFISVLSGRGRASFIPYSPA